MLTQTSSKDTVAEVFLKHLVFFTHKASLAKILCYVVANGSISKLTSSTIICIA